jgi:lipopolysaccharide/colanic/teichoic acid biosynthesis glycosyltransferase
MKRVFDLFGSIAGLVIASPILIPVMIIVWYQDKHSPFYVAERVGLNKKSFKMYKLRSMVINADKSGVDSTGANDSRITPVGHFIRRYKLDELSQLFNVLIGDMSLVGPRPNVRRETDLYTHAEMRLLQVKPGITDFASIVFSDEGEILKHSNNPDLLYNQLIRPGKGYLGLFYIENQSFFLDIKLCILTVIAIFSRSVALRGVVVTLKKLRASDFLLHLASRKCPLEPMPPPGAENIVISR